MSDAITVAAPPTAAEVAVDMAAWIGGQSGVLTDFNIGSQVRTDSEALGSVIEMQGVSAQAEAFQAMVYSTWQAFGIYPYAAQSATGTVTFVTGTAASPPPSPYSLLIPAGTLVQTQGGTQFATISDVILPAGATSVSTVVSAVVPGVGGNVPALAIVQIPSALQIPLAVSNVAPTSGGTDAETPPQTMARFTAAVSSIGRADPVSIANSCIGVAVSGTVEVCRWATVFEPWIQLASLGVTPLPAGFQVFVDNGSGSASTALIAAITANLNGNQSAGQEGYRPAGVPFTVNPPNSVYCTVQVSGAAVSVSLDAALEASTNSAITTYFAALAFGQPAQISTLLPQIANQVAGNVSTLSVGLYDISGVSQQAIQPPGTGRVILRSSSVVFA